MLHVLPHRGGGAETYIDILEGIDGFSHARVALSVGRSPRAGAASIGARYPLVARRVLGADVVHVHGDTATMIALPLLALRPAVWTTHGLHLLRRVDGRVLALSSRLLRRAIATTGRTICTSQASTTSCWHSALRGPPSACRSCCNGIDITARHEQPSSARRRAPRSASSPMQLAVLFLGELDVRKRPLDAIDAVELARDAGAPVVLLVAGDGPQRDAVERARVGRRAPARTRPRRRAAARRGRRARDAVRARGDVVRGARGDGRGLALVVSDGVGNPEAVGDAGLVLPLGDVRALAGALAALAGDREELARLGAAARARVTTS